MNYCFLFVSLFICGYNRLIIYYIDQLRHFFAQANKQLDPRGDNLRVHLFLRVPSCHDNVATSLSLH